MKGSKTRIWDWIISHNFHKLEETVFIDDVLSYLKQAEEKGVTAYHIARKQKGSHNREKQRVKVAAAHEKIANQRNDFLQKQSTMLVREFAQIPWQEDIRRASRSVTQKGKP